MTIRPEIVLFADIRFPSPRANGIQVVKTAQALAARGREVRLVVRHSDPRSTAEILAGFGVEPTPRLQVDRLKVGHAPNSSLVPRLRYLTQAFLQARRVSRMGGFVVTRDLQLADLLLRLGCDRLTYEAHAVEAIMYDERQQLYDLKAGPSATKRRRIEDRERRVWAGARGFMATTQGILATFERLFGARPRTAVVPNGCDIPKDRAFTPPSEDQRVVYAGQLYPWKGVDVLVQAFARLTRGELVIVGGLQGESDFDRIQNLARSLDLGDRIHFLGSLPQKDVAAQLARATVVVAPFLKSAMTSEHTSPIKAFEAMAAGRPLLISDTGASREIVEDNRTGILVAPGNVEAWVEALERVLSDRALQTTLARAAFEKASHYSWARRAERIEEFLGAAA
ncbi:MAG: glycosyltransferase [Vicinamibacteria bacterium]|nr:glycosyltransferase [Vicinamibacteria bacterium]